jgi:hypothetical protein
VLDRCACLAPSTSVEGPPAGRAHAMCTSVSGTSLVGRDTHRVSEP